MLPSTHRIGQSYRIQQILRRGLFFRSFSFQAKLLTSNEAHNRFALIVSKKTAKKAVIRNRIRRRLDEAVRKCIHAPSSTCYDIVILARSEALTTEFSRLVEEILTLLKTIDRSPPSHG
ncbi:ribonuclease P protein component [Candidatus Peregrinibacteria bacterium CG_4_9_14_0_2_um_filter_53_11]|nr:MAG: ribonuclease P protein component [Candidatus Peregrinibacteria bacterium CG_4_9_14_0_2_um_filter_53_11]